MPLKIGDIKGYEIEGQKIPCVLTEERHNYFLGVNILGETVIIPKSTPYSIVRLDPKVRAGFEKIGKEAKEIEKKKKEIEKINAEIKGIARRMDDVKKDVIKHSGKITREEFIKVVYENLEQAKGMQLVEYFRNARLRDTGTALILVLCREVAIEKYARPRDYPFLRHEYDGVVVIETRESESYKEIVSRYARENPRVLIEARRGVSIRDKSGLYLADNNQLTYQHEIQINIQTKRGQEVKTAQSIGQAIKIK